MDPRREQRELAAGAHIVVGTPGRLCDHLRRGRLDVSELKAVVLDEADEMLDLGFREDLEFILKTTPETRRTLLFSATLPRGIVALAKQYQQQRVPRRSRRRRRRPRRHRISRHPDRGRAMSSTPSSTCCAIFESPSAHRVLQHAQRGQASAGGAAGARLLRGRAVRRTDPERAHARRCRRCATAAPASASPPTSPRAASICRISASSSTPICRTIRK